MEQPYVYEPFVAQTNAGVAELCTSIADTATCDALDDCAYNEASKPRDVE